MLIDRIIDRAKENKKTIILPESMDARVVEAAKRIVNEGIANIILIGKTEFNGITTIDPEDCSHTEEFIKQLYEMRKDKGMTLEESEDLIKNNYMYFACMLLYNGYADGIVSGAFHSTSETLRPALQIIKSTSDIVSSFFLMEVPNCTYGENGTFVFSDCGLIQKPNTLELASIAIESSKSFGLLTNAEPKVAMLSYSTKGSAEDEDFIRIHNAIDIVKKQNSSLIIDGEMQVDAAIIPEVSNIKCADSPVGGYANTLIFPDLNSGNIAYKLTERLARAKSYGPITQGLTKPVNDLSRGCSVEDIVGVVAITALQAIK